MEIFCEFDSNVLAMESLVDGKLLVLTETGNYIVDKKGNKTLIVDQFSSDENKIYRTEI